MTKAIIAAGGADITKGRTYNIYTRDGVEYFKDNRGDERLVSAQLHRGATYAGNLDHRRGEFSPGDRVKCIKRHAFQGGVDRGTLGTVVIPRDPGVNVKWDNGFSVRDGSATISPEDIIKVDAEPSRTSWEEAPEWATHYGIEPDGRHYWFNLPPIELNKHEFRRGLDTRRGNKHRQCHPNVENHNGKFYVEARPSAPPVAPVATPQEEARYVIRILKCRNPVIQGSFVATYRPGRSAFTGSHTKDNRGDAKRFSYPEVVEFLKARADYDKGEDFEVVLDFIKTGHAKPEPAPKRGNNGWAVGTRLRCNLSGHPELHPRKVYVVTRFDGDGDEVVRGESGEVLAKYGRSERNEYTVISEGK